MSVTTGSAEHTTGRTDPSSQEQTHKQEQESRQYWPAVVCLSLGIFAIVTSEILPIGLLTPIGGDFGVSDGTAGWLMTVPGLLAAICAPLVTVCTGRLDRRTMLVALIVLLAVANFLAAAAPAFWVMLVARSLVGVTIGGFWSIGAGLAPRLVRAKVVGTATAVIFAAVPAGSVLGLPAGTQLGEHIGWRASFAVMGVIALGVSIALLVLLPPLPALQVTRAAVLRGLLRGTDIRIALALTALIVITHFGAYTYVTPFLEQVTHVDRGLIGVYLLIFGVAGIVGNFVAGVTMARGLRATFLTCAVLIAAATLLFPLLGRWDAGAIGLLVVWGLAYGAVPACSQTWFARSAPQAREAAMVVFTSSFQLTFAVGALLGGAVVDATSPSTVMLCAGAVALTTVATISTVGGPAEAPRHTP
ncbi:MFS transporter [Embleya sp. NPDC050493]|uniref:MFS transporter n=1 Tax=Embleya sp. NPDC050493 TaxID=3363989 RepID=UPI0037A93551